MSPVTKNNERNALLKGAKQSWRWIFEILNVKRRRKTKKVRDVIQCSCGTIDRSSSYTRKWKLSHSSKVTAAVMNSSELSVDASSPNQSAEIWSKVNSTKTEHFIFQWVNNEIFWLNVFKDILWKRAVQDSITYIPLTSSVCNNWRIFIPNNQYTETFIDNELCIPTNGKKNVYVLLSMFA